MARQTENTSVEFLEDLYRLAKAPRARQAMSLLFARINSLLLHGNYEECRELIRNVDMEMLPCNVLLGFLTFTFAARGNLLPDRDDLFFRIQDHIAKDRANAADAHNLLKTLR